MTPGFLSATYRLQFGPDLSFAKAASLAPYLRDLGISHVYASPITEARPGSTHGYDGTDPTAIRQELGGESGFRSMAAALREQGIGLLIDIVPNHLATDPANPYWMDVLEFGRHSRFSWLFDIEWDRKLTLPFVAAKGDPIERLHFDDRSGRVLTKINGTALPIRPGSLARLLEATGNGVFSELIGLLRRIDAEPDPEEIRRARAELRRLAGTGELEAVLDGADWASLLSEQHWQAVHWHAADLSYRRFFDVTQLIGVRVEDPAIFDWMHALPLSLLREGLVDGLRVDHVDGLADPGGYCERLRQAAGPEAILLVEKILGRDEALRDWPVDGTTGYERLGAINELFVEEDGRRALRDHLDRQGWLRDEPGGRIAAAKAEILRRSFGPELSALVELAEALPGVATAEREMLSRAIVGLLAAFPVYRSYLRGLPADAEDGKLWSEAARRVHDIDPPAAALAGQIAHRALAEEGAIADRFRTRFQQLSGPAMAKGVEDTELYRDVALLSVNEVGAEPGAPMRSPEEIHRLFAATGARALTPLATHDTKRGADTRARLDVLSRQAHAWIDRVEVWEARHAEWKTVRNGAAMPDGLDEWLIYQTLFGAWPIASERMEEYLLKAVREAKRHGSWTEPDADYEAALTGFANRLLTAPEAADFRSELTALVPETNREVRAIGIAQTVLQMLIPGVPDVYQGTEIWDHSLVDPDNRRPVDWNALQKLARADAAPSGFDDDAGAARMFTIRALAKLRRHMAGFADADYRASAIEAKGWFAFRRRSGESEVLVAVPLAAVGEAGAVELRFLDGDLDGTWQAWLSGTAMVEISAGRVALDPDWPFLVVSRDRDGSLGTEPR